MYSTFDTPITIYTVYSEKPPNGRLSVIVRTVVSRASWFGRNEISEGNARRIMNSSYTVRIRERHMPKNFIDPYTFDEMEDKGDSMTIHNGDVIVKGIVYDEPARLSEITNKYTDSFMVNSFTDNRRGIRRMRHYRIDGKT